MSDAEDSRRKLQFGKSVREMITLAESAEHQAATTDECCILFEKITRNDCQLPPYQQVPRRRRRDHGMRYLELRDLISELNRTEYPSYAATELELFYRLESEAKMPAKVPNSVVEREIVVLDDDEQILATDRGHDSMQCKILLEESSKAAESNDKTDSETQTYVFPDNLIRRFSCDSSTLVQASESVEERTTNESEKLQDDSLSSPYKCKVCQFSTLSLADFKLHLIKHVKETQCEADIHNTSVVTLRKLNSIKSNTECKSCRLCPMKFRKRADVMNHVFTAHSDRRPYQCQRCPKNYTRSSHLTRHQLTHRKK